MPRRFVSAVGCFFLTALGLLPLPFVGPSAFAAPPPGSPKSVSDFVPDPATVVRYGPAYRYPQSGWIVVHIEGAPYDRGYQHGHLLAAEIVDYINMLANSRSPKAPTDGWKSMRTLVNALFLRRYDAEYLQEMKGIADGAAAAGAKFDGRSLDLVDIVALNSDIEYEFLAGGLEATPTGLEGLKFREPPFSHTEDDPDDHCSAFAATGPATADGGIVFGHITMFDLYYVRHFNVWLDIKPSDGHRVVFQGYPGAIMSGLDYYMNGAGLLVAETTIRQTGYDIRGQALASRIRRVIQYADSIDKAVEILKDSNNGLYSNEWLFGDIKTNEIAMFELGTHQSQLWRSSKREWPGGTEGFYWGCNNAKDMKIRKETIPSLADKPANLVLYPQERDKAWLQLFKLRRGKIGLEFGFEAFTLPPLAAFSSCDAKFTTTALARDLKSWSLFGPPLGRTWDPSPDDVRKHSDVRPLVSNDWALIHVNPPAEEGGKSRLAVDLKPFREETKESPVDANVKHVAAWRGTLLPRTDADIWLAAGFSDLEKIVSLQNSLKHDAGKKELSRAAQEKIDLAWFAPESRWMTSVRRLGADVPLDAVRFDWTSNDWYHIAAGKGLFLLATLRTQIGAETFDKLMDEFGQKHGGQDVSTVEFRAELEKTLGQSFGSFFDPWLKTAALSERTVDNFWSIFSFETEPDRTLIVYGTQLDQDAQREAAELLQRKIARRFSNATVKLKSDKDVTDDELASHHLLLVGRPSGNRISSRFVNSFPVKFGSASFVLKDETYAHADSAVIAAGSNSLNPRYSVVIYAGLGARATRHLVESIPDRGGQPAEAFLITPGMRPKFLRVSPAPVLTANPSLKLSEKNAPK